ncbi:MAG TPA: helicase-associated domain-containing protein [Methanofastidiosum sp.]|nr:helicase-associated domain-containing protein [Methanofastidiosum sp.]HNZ60369.1 helicase-associated domain-containing protein [Methanofastidiosum sp.]HOE92850.1 helicase-associated domain-containing protein [Methanofastidiosum sp.]HOR87484.1 helicase-associated domain-containing protein [Methanofastidiosum sp.]HOT84579.1 helicase-associated domain-containing protein [Methanofastidiosum sp.]
MDTWEKVKDLSSKQVENALRVWGIDITTPKEQSIDFLKVAMENENIIESVFNSLSLKEKEFLGILLMAGGVKKQQDAQNIFIEKYSFWTFEEVIKTLETDLLVLEGVDGLIKTYVVNPNLREKLINIFKKVPEEISFDNLQIRKDKNLLISDLIIFLSFIAKEELKLTAKKEISKKDQERFIEKLHIKNESRSQFIESLALDFGLIKISGDQYILTDKINEILPITDEDLIRLFFKYIFFGLESIEGFKRKEIFISRVNELNIRIILDAIKKVEVGKNIYIKSFIKRLQNMLFDEKDENRWIYFDDKFFEKVISDYLLWLGIVDGGFIEGKMISFSLTEFGRELLTSERKASKEPTIYFDKSSKVKQKKILFMTPNFEISVLSEEIDKIALFDLNRFADIQKADMVSLYQITSETIMKGIESGFSLDKIINFLKKYSSNDIPQNVIYQLRDWASKYGKVRAFKGTFIVVNDIPLFLEINKRISSYIEQPIEPNIILIKEENIPKIREILEKNGIFIQIHIEGYDEKKESFLEKSSENIDLKSEIKSIKEGYLTGLKKEDTEYFFREEGFERSMDIRPNITRDLLEASKKRKSVLLSYFDLDDKVSRTSRINPLGVVVAEKRYLVGYDTAEKCIKALRIDVISDISIENNEFLRPDNFTVKNWWKKYGRDYSDSKKKYISIPQ